MFPNGNKVKIRLPMFCKNILEVYRVGVQEAVHPHGDNNATLHAGSKVPSFKAFIPQLICRLTLCSTEWLTIELLQHS